MFSQNETKLTVYFFRESSCSQRVLACLIEKDIPYTGVEVNIWALEQYEPWYARINPRMEVPTLKHGDKIITDSARIIDYLEQQFPNHPMKEVSETYDRMLKLLTEPDKVSKWPFIGALTIGSFVYPEYTENCQMSSLVLRLKRAQSRSLRLSKPGRLAQMVEKLVEANPDLRGVYQEKVECIQSRIDVVATDSDSDNFLTRALDTADSLLLECETHLRNSEYGQRQDEQWLCGPAFTLVDIYLVTIISRLNKCGLYNRLMKERPLLREYFNEFLHRKSASVYKQPLLGVMARSLAKRFIRSYGLTIAVSTAILFGAYYVAKTYTE